MQKQFTKENSYIVKGLAVILLLTYHLFEHEQLVTLMEVNYSPLSLPDFLLLSGFGNICVAVFVFLTAYGIGKGLLAQESISPKTALSQACRRCLRLCFQFAFMYASVNLLWGKLFDYKSLYGSGKQGVLYILADALGLAAIFDTPTMNMTWWYMELAYILIFLVPLLVCLVRKTGYYLLPLAFLAPRVLVFHEATERYLFTAVLGVCAAYGNWPDRLLNLKGKRLLQWLAGLVGLLLSVLIRQNYAVREYFEYLIDAPIALLLVFVAGALLASVPVLNRILSFIGRHSMNIYLVHTFFYMMLWQQFIYRFRYAGVTLLLLLAVCLGYSVVLEAVKKMFVKVVDNLKNRYYTKNIIK